VTKRRRLDIAESENLMRLGSALRKRHFFSIPGVAVAALSLVLDLIISARRDRCIVVRLIWIAAWTGRCVGILLGLDGH
jgi:hypothetical protein